MPTDRASSLAPACVTLAERDRREAARRARAAEAAIEALTRYARAHGGRFLVHGSVAQGRVRADSDIDILLDFSEDGVGEAWRFAETLCWRHRLVPDIRPLRWYGPAFRRYVMPGARVLA